MKEKIETLEVKKNEVTLAKVDIVAMYLSIQFLLVKKAVRFYSKDLSKGDKEKNRNISRNDRFWNEKHTGMLH